MDYLKLQNGSDIRGFAINSDLSPRDFDRKTVRNIGSAFSIYLHNKFNRKNLTIACGHDSRITAKSLFSWLCEGINLQGDDVVYTGLSSTPAMFMSTVMEGHKYDAAVMITASHLPYDRNGFKFFTSEGGFEKSDIKEILTIASTLDMSETQAKYKKVDIMSDYSKVLRDVIKKAAELGDKPLSGLKILVDAGNGAGGFFAANVLMPLGADISASVYLEPDGNFPNHAPNPEDKNAMAVFSNAVKDADVDLGIIFDTDVDRSAVAMPGGMEINRNRLIALMTAIVCMTHDKPVIVTDSVTSTGLAQFIAEKGGKHIRFKRGYRNVINEAKRLCKEGHDACLAIETSGHGAMRDNYFLDDGAYMAALICASLAKARKNGNELSELIQTLKEPAESVEIRFNIADDDFAAYGNNVLTALENEVQHTFGFSIAPDNFEGVRVNCDKTCGDGWFLMRMSLHDPVLPLNIESDSQGGVEIMKEWIMEFVKKFDKLTVK